MDKENENQARPLHKNKKKRTLANSQKQLRAKTTTMKSNKKDKRREDVITGRLISG
ncbi:hypothetical protein PORCRE_1218 [Porphyromonas crevioricanis JCM 15906]|uniref:Uncharacterized protein n=1 Tax=Porphyromonas crevioricanis JCM 15906 TaxID=1305617 RepID=T1DSZ8_9PORP|nr:hypothetical protein PORCRE_1218 [Porphyromonas crevioricanis JCM 15906]GAD07741.1 hypothetical protein PORCAN_1367 [Porphyromonas crevioricanis JCM 13913]